MADDQMLRLPDTVLGQQYLYVVVFNTGTLKVGRTQNPAARLKNHATTSRPHGISVSRQWLSQPHRGAKDNERLLTAFCSTLYRSANEGEYYLDADPDAVLTHAMTLPAGRDGSLLRFQEYGRNAGRKGAWPQGDPAVVVSLPGELMARVDQARGSASRDEWLRALVANAVS